MKTHFIRFKRGKDPVYIWKCTEEQFNKTMFAIGKYAQMIDLRDDLGQIFTFKDFDGAGEIKQHKIVTALPEPEITPEDRKRMGQKMREILEKL